MYAITSRSGVSLTQGSCEVQEYAPPTATAAAAAMRAALLKPN
jgi:hypothetical protein